MKKNVNFSVVQWLRLYAVNAEGPVQSLVRTVIQQPMWHGQIKKKKLWKNDQRLRDLRVQK